MSTVRTLVTEALQAVGAIALGDDPSADELTAGLQAFKRLTSDLHEGRGPMLDVDIEADYIAWENQRCRVQAGDDVTVTLPNSGPLFITSDPYDYGFAQAILPPPQGSLGAADGNTTRAPRDGTRIEVVGTSHGLWFYRDDINSWISADPLLIDSEAPFNKRLDSGLVALLAERLIDLLPNAQLTPTLAARIGRGRASLMLQTGKTRDPVRAEYF